MINIIQYRLKYIYRRTIGERLVVKFLKLPGNSIEILSRPVSREEYRLGFQNELSDFSKGSGTRSPVTGVSATEARKFASQMGARLPEFEEMMALSRYAKNNTALFGCLSRDCLAEWLNCSPDWARENNHTNCILSPSWLMRRDGSISRGSIPDQKMSFVTFRLVRN